MYDFVLYHSEFLFTYDLQNILCTTVFCHGFPLVYPGPETIEFRFCLPNPVITSHHQDIVTLQVRGFQPKFTIHVLRGSILGGVYLEDHPRTCKWLITMVIVSPLSGFVPLPNGLFMAGINGCQYLLTNWDDPPSIELRYS